MNGLQGTLPDRSRSTHRGSVEEIPPLSPGTSWQLRAACRVADATWFFPSDRERASSRIARTTLAKAVCAGCPVIVQCRAHALATREPFGIWGGLTEQERASALRARRRAQVRLARATETDGLSNAPGARAVG